MIKSLGILWETVRRAVLPWIYRDRLRSVRVEEIPDAPKNRNLYLIGGRQPWSAAFLCPCKCGEVIQLSFLPHDSPSWSVTVDRDDFATLAPFSLANERMQIALLCATGLGRLVSPDGHSLASTAFDSALKEPSKSKTSFPSLDTVLEVITDVGFIASRDTALQRAGLNGSAGIKSNRKSACRLERPKGRGRHPGDAIPQRPGFRRIKQAVLFLDSRSRRRWRADTNGAVLRDSLWLHIHDVLSGNSELHCWITRSALHRRPESHKHGNGLAECGCDEPTVTHVRCASVR